MYRHVGLLTEAGVLEVADERRVHGAVERHYRLRRERAVIDDEAAAGMSLADHRRGFAAALAALHAEFTAYLDRPGADPATDPAGYRQGTVWLNQAEIAELAAVLHRVFAAGTEHRGTAGRRPYLLSPIFFPVEHPVD